MIEVINSGFFTTVQDQGRTGQRKWGVPVSGAMDQTSADLANRLLDNPENAALLEIALNGPKLRFQETVYFSLTGAEVEARLGEQELKMNTPYKAEVGEVLDVRRCIKGVRTYIGFQGGIQTEEVLGSRSYYYPVTHHSSIQKGDVLTLAAESSYEPRVWGVKSKGLHLSEPLAVIPGPEYDQFPTEIVQALFEQEFHIAKENNRMAYQLLERLEPFSLPMITSVTTPGTIQLTSSGRLIILMRDAQTTGGYPRVLQLDAPSINALAQRSTGDEIRFKRIEAKADYWN